MPLDAVVPLGDTLELGQADRAALIVGDDLLALGAFGSLGTAGARPLLLLWLGRLARRVVVLENVSA